MPADLAALAAGATGKARHEMTVCNACRYCEAYCPVFQAMETRLTFAAADVAYFANLCHNCGECLYACQYAPPHEFGIDVPRTFSAVRVESYAAAAWPAVAGAAFRRPWTTAAIALMAGAVVIPIVAARTLWVRDSAAAQVRGTGDFYNVIPHDVMVTLFGIAGLLAVVALVMGYRRFAALQQGAGIRDRGRAFDPGSRIPDPDSLTAARDVLTLRHLHTAGQDCTDAEEARRPWRRWMHHCTFYGFLLCFASTSVAAVYHLAFGWIAPYAYTSLPVVLGTAGGLGLVVGPVGLFLVDRWRDPALTHPSQASLDGPFLATLLVTSLTGLLLLALREGGAMPSLLVAHLAFVLAMFITLPYGKFVHGIYRAAALVKFRRESGGGDTRESTT